MLSLTVADGVALVVGFVWTVVRHRNRGLCALQGGHGSAGNGAFRGKSVGVQLRGHVGFDELKDMLARHRWADALPLLVMMAGMVGLPLFGAPALLLGTDQKVAGALFLAPVVVAVVRIAIGFERLTPLCARSSDSPQTVGQPGATCRSPVVLSP